MMAAVLTGNIFLYSQFTAFTPQAGGGRAELNINYINYERVMVPSDDTSRQGYLRRSVTDLDIRLAAEYSIIDELSIFGMFPLRYVSTSQTVNPYSDYTDTLSYGNKIGIGNVEIGVKYRFLQKKVTMAVSLTGELMTSSYEDKVGLSTGYQGWGINPMLHLAKAWKSRYYILMNGGGCYRTGDYSADWRLSAEAGAYALKAVWLKFGADARGSFFNGSYMRPTNMQTALFVNDQQWVALYGSIGYESKGGFGVSLQVRGNVWGENIPVGAYVGGKIYYQWKYLLPE